MSITFWISIGAIVSGKGPTPLPTSVEQCLLMNVSTAVTVDMYISTGVIPTTVDPDTG